jgi:hypothetical protein
MNHVVHATLLLPRHRLLVSSLWRADTIRYDLSSFSDEQLIKEHLL